MMRKQGQEWLVAALLSLALVGVFFAALDAFVEWRTREALKMLEGYEATFENASLNPLQLKYRLDGLEIIKTSAGAKSEPVFAAKTLTCGVYWRELLHGHSVAHLLIDEPRAYLIAARAPKERQLKVETPNLAEKLKRMLPLTLDRAELRNGEVVFIDKTEPQLPRLHLRKLGVTVENLATRAALARGEPTVAALFASIQKSGEVSAFVSADPLAQGLFFAGRVKVSDLDMRELNAMFSAKSDLVFDRGTLDVFIEFNCQNGILNGGVKPVLKNANIIRAEPGLSARIKAALADNALEIFSDRIPGRNAAVTVVPIQGSIKAPNMQLWPAVLGVIRNAFVEAFSASFAQVPPAVAAKPQNPLTQALQALDKDKGPPKAQPTRKKP